MKLVALLALLAAACGSSGGSGSYPKCPQHRVEGFECMASTDGSAAASDVLHKGGLICATCKGVDMTGNPTPAPVGCVTVAGGDLCVADCGECS
jgi:hypothetical protein